MLEDSNDNDERLELNTPLNPLFLEGKKKQSVKIGEFTHLI
jgi:hypothetical protein